MAAGRDNQLTGQIAAICSICFLEWVRGLRDRGIGVAISRNPSLSDVREIGDANGEGPLVCVLIRDS
jgi:hypothetical protein